MNASSRLLVLLILVGLVATLGLWVLAGDKWFGDRAPLPVAGGESDAARLDRIEAELSALREAIENLDSRRNAPVIDSLPRRTALDAERGIGSVAGEQEDWRQSLDVLETRLTDQLTELREGLREDLDRKLVPARIRDAAGAINWGAWEEVVALWHEDQDRARAEVKLLTADEVLERFGAPSDVFVNPNGLTWQYAQPKDATSGVPPLEIILRIPDGYVVQLAVRDQRR